jgi:hypothetical protein
MATKAIGDVRPRDRESIASLRSLADRGNVPGELARTTLDQLTSDYVDDLKGAVSKPQAVEVMDLLGLAAGPGVIDVLLQYVGEHALDDDPMMRRAAAKAIENACSSASLELTSEEMLSLVEATEGPGREVDAEAGSFLSSALSRARLGDDVALCLLYEMADSQPKASPDELFGDEKKDLLEHLTLYAKERDKGEHGWRGQIAQLDLIAERLGCAAYLKLGSKETLKQQIRTREKYAYGNVIGGLAAVARVSSAQAPLGVLRDLRSKKTQITHVGTSPGEADLVTAHQTFKSAAKTLLIALDSSGPTSR